MHGRCVGLAAVGLAVVLGLALVGCGLQQPADQPTQGEGEEVYTFRDGTEVRGEAAAWVREALAQFPGKMDLKPAREKDARRILGDYFALPEMPDRFHLVGYWIDAGEHPSVRAYWAAPASKEWIDLALEPRGNSPITYFGRPLCDSGTEIAGQKLSDVIPWATHRCTVEIQQPGFRAYFWMANVPQEDASRMADSLHAKFLALKEE